MRTAPITIRLCGPLSVEIGQEHREQQLSGRQRQLLFAFLVLHRDRPVRRDELLDAITAQDGTPPGPAVLSPVLSRLRGVLAPARLEGRTTVTLALPSRTWVDVEAARAALRDGHAAAGDEEWSPALALAREAHEVTAAGLLPELEADWLDPHRAAVAELRVEALELAARAAVRVGGAALPDAEGFARAAVAAAPFRESARVALIRALQSRGNTAEAVQAYEDVRVLLRDELGVSPGPDLLALQGELLQATPVRTVPRPAPAPAAPPLDLEERGPELAALDEALRTARGGAGRVVVIEGPAGVGKSRLLTELRGRAGRAGVVVLTARAAPLERAFPFGVARQLLEPALHSGELGEADLDAAGPAARAALTAAPGADSDGYAVLHALHTLVRTLATRTPLALVVDDLQWSDRPSLRLLSYLTRRIDELTVLIAATVRTGEAVDDELRELAADPAAVLVRPAALGPAAVARLVARRLQARPDPAFAAACHEVTGGNPLLVDMLARALAAERAVPDTEHVAVVRTIGSRAVSSAVLTRLARLPAEATRVARVVAVAGARADLGLVAELAGLPADATADAAGRLVRAGVLRPEGEPDFVHPLVAEAVYRDLPPPERDLAHRRAAHALDVRGADADRVAAHLLAVGGQADGWAVARLRDAARLARARGAPENAVTFLERALAEPPAPDQRAEVLHDLGRAEAATRGPSAVGHLRAAVDTLTDPAARADAAQDLARTLLFVGRADECQDIALRVLAELPDHLADRRDALRALAVYGPLFGATRAVETGPLPDVPETPGSAMLMAAAFVRDAVTRCSPDPSVARARQVLSVDRLLDEDNPFWMGATILLVMADCFDEAAEVYRGALGRARRRGSLFTTIMARTGEGLTHLRAGRLDLAENLLAQATDHFQSWGVGQADAPSQAVAYLAECRLERGDLTGAEQALDPFNGAAGAGLGTRLALVARGELHLAQGRSAAALQVGRRLAALPPTMENPSCVPWRSLLARALAATDQAAEARAVAVADLERARLWGTPSAIGRALRVLGEVEGDAGLPALRDAVDHLANSPARLEHAKALASLAVVTPAPEHDGWRRAALAVAEDCGAALLTRRLRDLSTQSS